MNLATELAIDIFWFWWGISVLFCYVEVCGKHFYKSESVGGDVKVIKFHNRYPYAYIKCGNAFEIRAIEKRIQQGRLNARPAGDACGPKSWGAQFILERRNKKPFVKCECGAIRFRFEYCFNERCVASKYSYMKSPKILEAFETRRLAGDL